MTIVNTDTGEVVEALSESEARRLTERIRLSLSSMLDIRDKVLVLIREARERQAYTALGYPSWTAYVADEFAEAMPRLTRDERTAVAVELAEMGMSSRAIAPVAGLSDRQVRRIAGGTSVPPAPQIPEPDGSGEAPSGSGQTPQGEGDRLAAPPMRPAESARDDTPRPAVTGLDGKQYTRPKPRPVLAGSDAEFDNAAQACKALTKAVSKLLEFEHPNMRAGMRRYWSLASGEISPTQRADITPDQMRAAARGLLDLADEWSA